MLFNKKLPVGTWKAKYPSICTICNNNIYVGQPITWKDNKYNKKVVHVDCFNKRLETE